MSTKSLIPQSKTALIRASEIVPYLLPEEVYQMAEAASKDKKGRNGERDKLLIVLLFETGLRVSEALSLTPRLIGNYEGNPVLYIRGKGKKRRMVACPEDLAPRIKSYACTKGIGLDERIFRINRKRVWQIVNEAGEKAGLQKKVWLRVFHFLGGMFHFQA